MSQLISQTTLERYSKHPFLKVYQLQEDNPKGPEPTLTVRTHSSMMTPINYSTSVGDNNNSLPATISDSKPDEQTKNPTDPISDKTSAPNERLIRPII